MSVEPISQLYPVTLVQGDERETRRPIGRNRERYQKVVRDWTTLAQTAEQSCYWRFSTIAHHFHSEGHEVGPNPGVMNAWWAGITENLRMGALDVLELFPRDVLPKLDNAGMKVPVASVTAPREATLNK